MKRLCVLLTRLPGSDEDTMRVFGGIRYARSSGAEVGLYLLGDGVLSAKDGPIGDPVSKCLRDGVQVTASAGDLEARGITSIVPGVEVSNDLEGVLVDDAMDRADKVVTW